MAVTIAPTESTDRTGETARLTKIWETSPGLYGFLATVDHKTIGKRYLATAFAFFLLGGLGAAIMRWQLARPETHLLSPEVYNQLFTMHGVTMIFLFASPILSGFSNYLWPLMIGARDMAFPRVNALSYWTFVMSGILLYSSLLIGQAPDGGWFAYVPMTELAYSPGLNMDFYALGMVFLAISTTIGAINFVVTFFKLRAPGMSVNRVPIILWGTLSASVMIVFAAPALTAACILLFFDRRFGMHFFDAANGGAPLLWQHLFWMFGHPWVYIVVLPAIGLASDMIPTFARRPLAGYTFVALSTITTAILGFGVWVHHMFATGLPQLATTFFSAASMMITIPSGVSIFAWIATLWYGRPVIRTPLLFLAGFIVLFVIGGLNGVMTAPVPFDWQLTDSYFVVAHIHYVLVGINVFPVFGAFYYWLPKMTGRMLSERIGRWVFWLMFVGANVAFFPMHIAGMLGMPRRIYTYQAGLGWSAVNMITTIGAYVFALGVALFIFDFFRSLRHGAVAGNNPWDGSTLEWSVSSPPPPYNFAVLPTVRSRYPLWEDRLGEPPQTAPALPALDDGRETFTTSMLDSDPQAVLRMPEDSIWPVLVSLSLLVLFYGVLLSVWWLAIVGAVGVFVTIVGWFWPGRIPTGDAMPSPEQS